MFMGKTTDDLRLIGFEPVVGTEPRVLILGSMPSEASLAAGCYYAHPRNRFWRVVGECFGFDPTLPYKERLDALEASGAALWDTIESCERTGSLDSAILRPQVNDFSAFFRRTPHDRTRLSQWRKGRSNVAPSRSPRSYCACRYA